MRIFYVLETFPAMSQVFISREIRQLESLGVKIRVLALHEPQADSIHRIDREIVTEVIYGHQLQTSRHRKALRHAAWCIRSPIRYVRTFWHALRCSSPDLWYIFTQTPLLCDQVAAFGGDRLHAHFAWSNVQHAWLAAKMLGIPFSVTVHGSDILVNPLPDVDRALRDADAVICVSEALRTELAHRFHIPMARTELIRCGIAVEEFVAQASLEGPLKLLSVARLHPVKGLGHLVKACAVLRDRGICFTCTIYGDGPERAALERQISDLGLAQVVSLPGPVSNEELPAIYASHTAFVLPSLSEGLGVVIMEAMAAGLPVVGSDVGGIPELIKPGVHGLLVPPGVPALLAAAIQNLASLPPSERQAMSDRNRTRGLTEFSVQSQAQLLIHLFGRRTRGQRGGIS
jgi:glycosyltransferase involved in cell wall biosynthesis